MARERARVRLRDGRAPRPPRPHLASIQAATRARRAAALPLPRPQAYVRHLTAHEERQPEGSLGDAWPLEHRHHPGHLLPRVAYYARERGPRPRRSPPLTGCSTVAVNAPAPTPGLSFA